MCEHLNHAVTANIFRLSKHDGGPAVRFSVEIQIRCAECGIEYQFLDLPHTVNSSQAGTSIDGLEARLPIKPVDSYVFAGVRVIAT